tara:strand:+ start:913 stop:1482 length:570 start_codon:yes stop_codon:yes gene_type:complete
MKKIAIFASGNGSNVENIIKFFKTNKSIKIALVASNNPVAGALIRGKKNGVSTTVFDKKSLNNGAVLEMLRLKKINFIVLAGFLLKIPEEIINNFKQKIINIHPSLLPLYGGKGMYGINVHQKVFDSKDHQTGITIHFVNKEYDEGTIIFQAKCQLSPKIKPRGIQKKVHDLEMKFFPRIIESLLNGTN